jgi:hypothetical protein
MGQQAVNDSNKGKGGLGIAIAWIMPLIYIVLTLIVAGVILWLINTYIPMAGSIKAILNLIVVVVVCVWVLQAFGLWQSVLNYRIPTMR